MVVVFAQAYYVVRKPGNVKMSLTMGHKGSSEEPEKYSEMLNPV
jgi:hypothetical protein